MLIDMNSAVGPGNGRCSNVQDNSQEKRIQSVCLQILSDIGIIFQRIISCKCKSSGWQ